MADNISKYNLELSVAERKRNAQKAGIASGVARRQRAEILSKFENPLYRNMMSENDINNVVDALIHSAKRGNIKAVCLIRDIVDGKPKPMEENNNITINIIDD